MKWIDSTDIKQWADTRDCQEKFPELIYRLILASSSSIEQISFPSGDSVCLSGWDGLLDSKEPIFNNIVGLSLWELGAAKNVKNKADTDYEKRIKDMQINTPRNSTFVFVTPRIWTNAKKWVNEKRDQNHWKDVVVITAIELEDWLFRYPTVGLWLAEHLGKTSFNGLYTVDQFWEKWSTGKNDLILEPNLLLGGRELEEKKVLEITQAPLIGIVQSIAQEESLAFIVASILNSDNAIAIKARCVIVDNEDTLEKLLAKYRNLLILAKISSRNHTYALANGHSIIYVASPADTFTIDGVIELPPINRTLFVESLQRSGLSSDYAELLSRETVRNITILRRKLGFDYNPPLWASTEYIRELIPAILVGRWDEGVQGDKDIVALIAGESYESYQMKLQKWLYSNDSPLICVDTLWRIASPYESFVFAAKYLATTDFESYKIAFQYIANDLDSDALARRKASSIYFSQFNQKYTNQIKEGIFQSAILISLLAENKYFRTLINKVEWIDILICNILKESTLAWWLSYKPVIAYIAEASPKKFLEFIQRDLEKENSIVKELFLIEKKSDLDFAVADYTDLLFTFEKLAWSREFLLSVSLILVELSGVKNESNISNRPFESLISIYNVWHPQTLSNAEERNRALQTVVDRYPKLGFDLCFKLIDRWNSTVSHCSPKMWWRLFGQGDEKSITYEDVYSVIAHIVKLMINGSHHTAEQVCQLIGLSIQKEIPIAIRDNIRVYLKTNSSSCQGDLMISDKLRDIIYRQESFSTTKWALPFEEVLIYKELLALIEPQEIKQKYLWMFKEVYLRTLEIDKLDSDYQKRRDLSIQIRGRVLNEIYALDGFNSILEFEQMATSKDTVGCVYAHISQERDFTKILSAIEKGVVSESFLKGYFKEFARVNGIDFLIKMLQESEEKYQAYIHIPLSAIYHTNETYQYVETLSIDIQDRYWRKVQLVSYDSDINSCICLIRKFNHYQRFSESLELVLHCTNDKEFLPELAIETVNLALSDANLGNEAVEQILKLILWLDKNTAVENHHVLPLEFLLYPHLTEREDEQLRIEKELLTNPEMMMELISCCYPPSDEAENLKYQEELSKNPNKILSANAAFKILFNFGGLPFVDSDYIINEDGLNEYIDELRTLGIKTNRVDIVDSIIGEMIGNYPERESYPPQIICRIIERLNSSSVNNGFERKLFNKRGVSPALTSGRCERKTSQKYKDYADSTRFTYPVITRIFESLSEDYSRMALEDDIRTKIQTLEY